jgi:hypothetical protein
MMEMVMPWMIGLLNVLQEIGNATPISVCCMLELKKYLGGSSQVQLNQQNCGGGCPIMNHLEAFGRQRADAFSEFKAELGVYLFK